MKKIKWCFKKKNVNIFKFFFHFFEPIDYLYFFLGIIGCIACGISGPLLTYINSNVYTDVGNSSENKGSLSEAELMKLKVKKTMESNIKKQLIYGSISFVGNVVAYFFIGLNSTRAIYNFKKNISRVFYLKNKDGLIQLILMNYQQKCKHS